MLKGFLATMVALFLLQFAEPAHAVMQKINVCDDGTTHIGWTNDGSNGFPVDAVVVSGGCHNTFADYGDDGGRPERAGREGGGGNGKSRGPKDDFTPNPGDATTQRSALIPTRCNAWTKSLMIIGDPVIFSTGNEVSPETDFASAGEMGLSLTRTYNYYWSGIGIFGRRWLSDYDFKLLFTTNDPASACYPRPGNSVCDPTFKPIWAQRPDGRMIKFNYASSPTPGWYEDKPSPVAKILKSGTTYVLYSEDHTVEVYDAAGFPSSLKNPQGIGWTFQYDSNGNHYLTRVTHTSGRHVDFTWTDGRLTQVTDPAGHAYTYSYKTLSVSTSNVAGPGATPSASMVSTGGIGAHPMLLPPHNPRHDDPPPLPPTPPVNSMVALLIGAIQPGAISTRTTYHYEDSRFPTALTGRTINDVRQSWITYDANGRASETKLAGNVERYQFSYALDASGNIQSTTVINPLSKSTTYKFDVNGNDIGVEEARSTNCPLAVKAAAYDANGYLTGSTDFLGRVTTFDFNAKGQLLERVENANATDASQRLAVRYTWDADSRKTKETVADDHEYSYEYGTGGRLTSLTVKNLSSKVAASQGQTRTTTYTYATWPSGLLSSMTVDGPLAGTGDTIVLTYSQAGDLLTVKNSLGQTTTYESYNNRGQPGFVTGPNGDKVGYVYDARGRVIDVQTYRNGATQHTTYEYDGFGRLARVIQPDGQYHGYQYDAAGRLVSEYEPEAGGTFEQMVYTYNAASLPTSVTTQRVYREPPRGTVP